MLTSQSVIFHSWGKSKGEKEKNNDSAKRERGGKEPCIGSPERCPFLQLAERTQCSDMDVEEGSDVSQRDFRWFARLLKVLTTECQGV